MQDAKEIYKSTVSHLSSEERLRLAALILDDLAAIRPNGKPKLSAVELINSFPRHRGFKTSSEADAYLRQERDSWDR